jgi:hypothetical protein
MNFETAQKIVWACQQHVMWEIGVSEDEPPPVAQYTLGELIQANDIIKEYNKIRTDRCQSMILADRLIASIYTMYHYHPNNSETVISNPTRGVVVVNLQQH